jgi:nitrite reductase/ring-hydroxylating ferredoxin subunit
LKTIFVSSLKDADLTEGKMHAVHVKGNPILLVKVNGQVYGVSNRCPHMGCELQSGLLSGYIVMCPCHGWKFDVRTGQYTENPLTALTSYRCKIENGKVGGS